MKDKLIALKELKERIANTDYLFFDLDGTLIDTEPLYQRFWKEASKYYGYELSDEEELTFRSLDASLGAIKIKEYSNGLLDYDQVKEMRIALMKEYFSNHEIIVKKDAIKFLKTLKEAGKHIFIVTANKVEKANNILLQTKLMPYIEGVISAKDVKRGKPYPDVFLYACECVNKEPKDIIVFEDSPNGLMSSSSAGCFTVMVEDLSPYTSDMDYVDAYIKSFSELL